MSVLTQTGEGELSGGYLDGGLNVHMGLFEKSFACVGIWLFMWAAGGVPSLMWVGRSLMWVGRGCRVRSCGPHFAHVGRAWVPGGCPSPAGCARVVLTSAMWPFRFPLL